MNSVDVYSGDLANAYTGRLSASNNKHIFSYDHDACEALSLTMPLRDESYRYDQLHPVFQMNLPEGVLRQAIERFTAKQYGSDDLTLLTILGRNQIGRIAYSSIDQPPATLDGQPLALSDLLDHQDVGLFTDLLNRYAQSSGVAGVQPKVLVDIQSHITLPVEHYIVKSWGDDYPHLACNEMVCMSMARDAGLTVPDFYLSDNARLFITRRFDVTEQGHALGFEDFCVLQGKSTKQKYDSSLEACSNTIRQYVSSDLLAQALYDFFKLTVLNIRLGNGDAHLKNSGIVYRHLADYRLGKLPEWSRDLAPIFDIVSTKPYLPRDMMALSLTGSKRWPKRKVLHTFAANHCQLSMAEIEQAEAEVEQGIRQNIPLLESLQAKHEGFADIGDRLRALL